MFRMAIKVALFGFRAQSTVVAQERVRAMAHASAAMRAGGVRMVAQQRLGNNARQAGCYIREGINRGGAISLAEHAVSPTGPLVFRGIQDLRTQTPFITFFLARTITEFLFIIPFPTPTLNIHFKTQPFSLSSLPKSRLFRSSLFF